jgi:hypothetical protein
MNILKNLMGAKMVQGKGGSSFLQQTSTQALQQQVTKEGDNRNLVQTDNPIVKTPNGVADGVMVLTKGEAPPASIEIVIDTDSLTTDRLIILGKTNSYLLATNAPDYALPPGVVTAGGSAAGYALFLDEICSRTYLFNSAQQTVAASTSATNQVAHLNQLNRNWKRYFADGQGTSGSKELKWTQTDNPYFQKDNIRYIEFGQMSGKFDLYSCVAINVMPKVVVTIVLMTTARALLS